MCHQAAELHHICSSAWLYDQQMWAVPLLLSKCWACSPLTIPMYLRPMPCATSCVSMLCIQRVQRGNDGQTPHHDGRWCHGSSLHPPCPSKAKPPPPTARLISNALRSTSDQTGSSVYFSFSLTDSRMFLLSFFTWYSQFSLFTFRPPTFIPDFGLMYPTFGLHLW